MTEDHRNDVIDYYDKHPAGEEVYRSVLRSFISYLEPYSPVEQTIVLWDSSGRDVEAKERIRILAWSFTETEGIDMRRRLFASLVTGDGIADGYEADFLYDTAIAVGITPEAASSILLGPSRLEH